MTPQRFFDEQLPAKIAANPDLVARTRGVFQFNVTGEGGGTWTVDLSGAEGQVRSGPAEKPGCTVTIGSDDLSAILERRLNAQQAFMTGKLKVQGDMGLALKLANLV